MPDFIPTGENHWTLSPTHPVAVKIKKVLQKHYRTSTIGFTARKYDVSIITEHPQLFHDVVQLMAQRYRNMGAAGPTHVAAVESRGYIIGAPLAYELGVPFVRMRREKLREGAFVAEGDDEPPLPPLSVRGNSITRSSRVVIVDDFISGGKSISSAIDCTRIAGSKLVEVMTISELVERGGVKRIHRAYPDVHIATFFPLKNKRDILFTSGDVQRSHL